ncbi:MAG TPA: DUF3833 family protein [Caulobacteraceae bacterium]|nr:DUF3833 family protein [Caulobacteraceae bacterium]
MASIIRETVHPGTNVAAAPVRSRTLVFRPEVFFLGRTEGAGVLRDAFGRVLRRCSIVTDGVFSPAYGALHFDETYSYEDGEVDVWRWAMTAGADGRYMAAEALAGTGIVGERRGGDYLVSFRRPLGRSRGLIWPRFATRFTLLAPEIALKQARVSIAGFPAGALTAVHRKVESPIHSRPAIDEGN